MALSDRIVVMQAGHILQVGGPEDIYQRPASRAVAAFFGAPNLLEAQVKECRTGGGGRQALVAGEGWQGECLAAPTIKEGDRAIVVIRPENMHVSGDGFSGGQALQWRGRLTQSIFRGPRRSVQVAAGGLSLNAEMPARLSAAVGDEVTLSVPAEAAWAVPA